MEGFHVSSDAGGVVAVEVAQFAAEFQIAFLMDVLHVTLDVRLVHALVRTEGALNLGNFRIENTCV